MTPEQFNKKFPDYTSVNENCLEDIACPKCGNRAEFSIVVSTPMRFEDDGSGDHEDTEWDEDSHCRCVECNHDGNVRHFRITGLDAYLEENR